MRGVEACLNEVFPFGLGDEGLELGRGESVNESCLRDDQEEDLGAGERGKLVCLFHDTCFPFGEGDMTSRFILNKFDLDLTPSSLLLVLGFLLFLILVAAALGSVMVGDERVIGDRGAWLLGRVGLGFCGRYCS
jgi:hypothetical protein